MIANSCGFIVFFCREIPSITDIKLKITCQNGVEFDDYGSLQSTLEVTNTPPNFSLAGYLRDL